MHLSLSVEADGFTQSADISAVVLFLLLFFRCSFDASKLCDGSVCLSSSRRPYLLHYYLGWRLWSPETMEARRLEAVNRRRPQRGPWRATDSWQWSGQVQSPAASHAISRQRSMRRILWHLALCCRSQVVGALPLHAHPCVHSRYNAWDYCGTKTTWSWP